MVLYTLVQPSDRTHQGTGSLVSLPDLLQYRPACSALETTAEQNPSPPLVPCPAGSPVNSPLHCYAILEKEKNWWREEDLKGGVTEHFREIGTGRALT
ncbi:hypothetical protein DPEC_G00340120 [Dallia pectoralis]|uniref:Uncharacterized protein n=1 Tax=Dallia pectoralis TaxID=75939 RepID=A0ACC2F5G3_DALPE|nr:hypothetical protein DPEC_G00340120 [Dallia pectoralis]